MECNKRVAIRALEIAEKRLLNRDYAGAKEMALKAENLFPQLDNISQLLTVSEVLCSSQLMPNGLYDWYKIIQVEPTSDENLIKKQHRNLMLLLHPDRNKFPGAEAALKLVVEANNTLSDRAKRIMYDVKRKHLARLRGPQQTTQINVVHNSSSNINRNFTFWTVCPGCKTWYQCYSNILCKTVYCINCPRSFVANALPHLNPGHMSGDGGIAKVSTGGVRKPDSNANSEPVTSSSVQRRGKRVGTERSKPSADPCPNQNPNPSSQPKFSSDVNPSRGDENQTNAGTHTAGTGTPLRRFLHNKPNVKNNGTKVDVSSPAKKARVEVKEEQDGNGGTNAVNTNTNASTCVEEEVREQDREEGKKQVVPSGSAGDVNLPSPNGDTSGPTLTRRCESPQPNADSQNLYEHPDSKFHNFDMGRACDHFQQGQMWALYSDVDTYPKYYGWIRKVEPDPFKVHISWLEACPKSEVEKLWFDANLPISCGKFKVTTENTIYDSPDYFSYMISVSHHKRGDEYEILPEVGEIWAVYKNWSAGWTLHDLKTCEYDVVQISEQREDSMVVFPMKQVSEHRSVFMTVKRYGSGSNKWEIPYIMFSHRIPAFRLTLEQGGKLWGFWELDPASVPDAFFNNDK